MGDTFKWIAEREAERKTGRRDRKIDQPRPRITVGSVWRNLTRARAPYCPHCGRGFDHDAVFVVERIRSTVVDPDPPDQRWCRVWVRYVESGVGSVIEGRCLLDRPNLYEFVSA